MKNSSARLYCHSVVKHLQVIVLSYLEKIPLLHMKFHSEIRLLPGEFEISAP
jgi:hypothetical protein